MYKGFHHGNAEAQNPGSEIIDLSQKLVLDPLIKGTVFGMVYLGTFFILKSKLNAWSSIVKYK